MRYIIAIIRPRIQILILFLQLNKTLILSIFAQSTESVNKTSGKKSSQIIQNFSSLYVHPNRKQVQMPKSQAANSRLREQAAKRFIHNLDQLVGHEDKRLYGHASQKRIDEAIENFPVVDDEGNNFSVFSSIQKFQKFSPGVYLMFKLMKHLMLMFGIISLISIIQIVILFKSPFYKGYEGVVRINMLRLTIASLQLEEYELYIALDAIMLLVICGFYVWWSQKMRGFANQCNQQNKLPSYLTVQLKSVSKSFNQKCLKQYLLNHEGILPQQIYTGRNYGKFLSYYRKLTECAIDFRIKKELFINEEDKEQKKKQAKPLIGQFLKLKNLYCSIKLDKFNEKKYSPKEVFVVLQNYEDRQKLIRKSEGVFNICSIKQTAQQEGRYDFKPCSVEPQAIAWENLGISFLNYAIRAIVVFFILSFVACLGVILIFMLEILETASIGDAYHYHEDNIKTVVKAASDSEKKCDDCHQQISEGKLTMLILLTPFVIFVCKKLIMGLLSHFVKFRKYPSEVSKIKSQTITLTMFYFIVICVLHLFLYLKTNTPGSKALSIYQLLHPLIIKMFSITNYSPASIHLYSDYSLDWYKESTFFIIIICSTSFNISNGFKLLVNFISFILQKRKARQQKSMFSVKRCLHGVDIHMQHVYASMLVINYFALLYGCPMPITVCFSFVNLVFLFYTSKISFIKFGFKPLRMGHSINRTVTNLLFLGVVIHCIMTPIFLCAEGIGKNNSHYKYNIEHPEEIGTIQPALHVQQRYQKLGPFYLTVMSFIIFYVLFRKPLINLIVTIIKKRLAKNEEKQQDKENRSQHYGLYPSYAMHNNPVYSEILKNILLMNRIQAKRVTCPMPKTFKQLESSFCPEELGVFRQMLEINRAYLDREKYPKLYEEVEDLCRIQQSSDIMIQSELQERATNDNILIDGKMSDRIKEQQ